MKIEETCLIAAHFALFPAIFPLSGYHHIVGVHLEGAPSFAVGGVRLGAEVVAFTLVAEEQD